jgi:hypothetical protein
LVLHLIVISANRAVLGDIAGNSRDFWAWTPVKIVLDPVVFAGLTAKSHKSPRRSVSGGLCDDLCDDLCDGLCDEGQRMLLHASRA